MEGEEKGRKENGCNSHINSNTQASPAKWISYGLTVAKITVNPWPKYLDCPFHMKTNMLCTPLP